MTRRPTTLMLASLIALAGCKDRFDEGYQAGYADGMKAGEKAGMERAATLQRTTPRYEPVLESRSVTTDVCGGGGVNVNGKHIKPGKTGCVKVFSDGTVQRY